ncbi:hypothetical protein GCM10027059_02800 [Myceligenerans halotolerans]
MTTGAEADATRVRVRITTGRFAGRSGLLVGSGPERATVDLGVPVDGGSGVVVVPASAVQADDQASKS